MHPTLQKFSNFQDKIFQSTSARDDRKVYKIICLSQISKPHPTFYQKLNGNVGRISASSQKLEPREIYLKAEQRDTLRFLWHCNYILVLSKENLYVINSYNPTKILISLCAYTWRWNVLGSRDCSSYHWFTQYIT